MSGKTKIEWADRVWNPVVGCTPVSAGCAHCYAKRMYNRFYQSKPFSEVQLHEERLVKALSWKKPCRVFVNSMSDLFHEDVPDIFIAKVFSVMAIKKDFTFMVLTKRPERMQKLLSNPSGDFVGCLHTNTLRFGSRYERPYGSAIELNNVWLGVSVEDQNTADERIPLLLQTPAAKRFVSVEPMLGVVDMRRGIYSMSPNLIQGTSLDGIDWVICGGESGPGARPMHPSWVRDLRDQCHEAGVPFLFKQWGEWAPVDFEANVSHSQVSNGIRMGRVGKQTAGRILDGEEGNEFPEGK